MEEVKVGNKLVKARQYPWGTVQGNVSVVMIRLCRPLLQFRCPSYSLWSVPIK